MIEKYILKTKSYSYDSDHYDEDTEEFEFDTFEEMKLFYDEFKKLPLAEEIPYWRFGRFIDMDVFNSFYAKLHDGCQYHYSTGGISPNVKAFFSAKDEVELEIT